MRRTWRGEMNFGNKRGQLYRYSHIIYFLSHSCLQHKVEVFGKDLGSPWDAGKINGQVAQDGANAFPVAGKKAHAATIRQDPVSWL